MKTITLNKSEVYEDNRTSKYWRTIECKPQSVELKTWSTNHPYFIIQGIITESHDSREIGQEKEVHVQTYSFWLEPKIDKGIYTINN